MKPATEELDAASRMVLMARGWLDRGRFKAAREKCLEALALRPDHADAHRILAYALIGENVLTEALVHLRFAWQQLPDDPVLQLAVTTVAGLAGEPMPPVALPGNPGGKIRFRSLYQGAHQRSGWAYALAALYPLHDSAGVLFEPFLEDPFAWQLPRNGKRTGAGLLDAVRRPAYETRVSSEELGIVPFREPWVGVLHNPFNMPRWFHWNESPQAIFAKPAWRESLESCCGFFALSRTLGDRLEQATGKPVSVLTHPTEIPSQCFDMDRFLASPQRYVVQIGWWLRAQSAIYRLPLPESNALGYRKMRLVPRFFPGSPLYLRTLMESECTAMGWEPVEGNGGVIEAEHLPNEEYDTLMAQNIVFVHLFDSSANNTVIECVARGTPLLINPLPAVVEYLGPGYPFYYSDFTEAAALLMDTGRIRAAHEYLMTCDTRNKLDAATFRRDFEASTVFKLL